jgi:Rad3-related DNA helicase
MFLDITDAEIDDMIVRNFPLKDFREGQKECLTEIVKAYRAGKRAVIIEGPTGAGKSAIGMTIASMANSAFYLTTQKILQTQIMKDFGERGVIDLKGRNAYKCNYWETFLEIKPDKDKALKEMDRLAKINPTLHATMADPNLTCDRGVCKQHNRQSSCKECFPPGMQRGPQAYSLSTCPYWRRLGDAIAAQTCLMNFNSFLFQTAIGGRFTPRQMMVVDECHNAETQLMDFVSFSITDKAFTKFKINIPEFETVNQYVAYFQEIDLLGKIEAQAQAAAYELDTRAEEEWTRMLFQFDNFIKTSADGNWVPEWEDNKTFRRVTLKPIFVHEHAEKYLFQYGERLLFMSATILMPRVIYESLGINKDDVFAYRMKSRFPAKNRPIYFDPVGSMNYKHKNETLPLLIQKIETICDKYPGQRGIIHTHSFEIAKTLIERCKKTVSQRFIFQENYKSKEEMLAEHAKYKHSVIVAPAMHEGLDLKDDLSRFQIICKVPYPSFVNNKQLQIRMEMSQSYYDWLTALKLVQSYGRSIRSASDYADTYILDTEFKRFLQKTKSNKLLPDWFREAVKEF